MATAVKNNVTNYHKDSSKKEKDRRTFIVSERERLANEKAKRR